MLPVWYDEYKTFIDKSVDIYIKSFLNKELNINLDNFKEAVIYSTIGWKRLRSILALEFYLIFTWKKLSDIKIDDNIVKLFVAIEFLHSYSLVHDDLPCMDNDELRRWQLTTWKKFWETDATLVWDLLNSLASELIGEIWLVEIHNHFSKAIWISWMLWGQVLDIYYENNPLSVNLDRLIETHNKKTGALIDTSIVSAIFLAKSESIEFIENHDNLNEFIINYSDFGYDLWLAFQIKDDLLDVEGSYIETGKSVWSWEKKWFIHLLWLEESKHYLNKVLDRCFSYSEKLNSEKIDYLIKYIATRKK